VKYRAMGAAALLRNNLLIYGVGGIIIPFIGIKLIDMVITRIRMARDFSNSDLRFQIQI
jgi:K+-transporting ATPase ATPase B chain